MLGKLIKYELPAMGRKLLPLYAAWAVAALMLGLTAEFSDPSDFMLAISVILYTAIATAVTVISIVMIVQRYSSSLLGNEGYFYHVLPVGTASHIGTKLISATVWVVITTFVAFLTGLLVVLGIVIAQGIGFEEVMRGVKLMLEINYPEHMWLYLGEGIILMIASIIKTIMQIYAALTIGYQASNHTTLASIAAFILLLIFESVIGRNIMPSMVSVVFSANGVIDFDSIFVPSVLISIAFSALYFLICKVLLDKRLNLG